MPVLPEVKGLLPGRGPAGRGAAGRAPGPLGAPLRPPPGPDWPPGRGPDWPGRAGAPEPWPPGREPGRAAGAPGDAAAGRGALGVCGAPAAGAAAGRGPGRAPGAGAPPVRCAGPGWAGAGWPGPVCVPGRGAPPGVRPAGAGAGASPPGRGPAAGRGPGVGAPPAGRGPGRTEEEGAAAAAGPCAEAGAAGAEGLRAPGRAEGPPSFLNASVNLRTTGASIVEDADRTNSPSSWSLAMTTLLSTPNSLASSYTRTFATSLLLVRGGRPPDRRYRMYVLIAYSSSAHRNLDLLPTREVLLFRSEPCPAPSGATMACNRASSKGPLTRNARGNAFRRSARARHSGSGCKCAPRPGKVPRGSGTHAPSTATTRTRSVLAARALHPTHVRTGPAASGRACPLRVGGHALTRVRPDIK